MKTKVLLQCSSTFCLSGYSAKFLCRNFPAFTLRQSRVKSESAHFHSFELKDLITYGSKHSFNLMVFTFADFDFGNIAVAFKHSHMSLHAFCSVAESQSLFKADDILLGQLIDDKYRYNGKEYSIRDYLAGVLYAEMGPSFQTEALKAQCVTIYTYGKYHNNFGKNFVANDHAMKSDVKNASKSDVIYDVVDEVMGQYLSYNGKVALAVYSATSAGTTAKCSDIWVQDLPYLTRVESKYDSTVSGYKKTVTYTEEEMKYKLENNFNVKLSSDPENWIQILSHDEAIDENIGHALTVSIDGQKTVKGARIYEVLGLRSPCYTVEYV